MGTARNSSQVTDDFESSWNALARTIPGNLQGDIKRQFVAKWNEQHPDDPRDAQGRRAGRVEVNAKTGASSTSKVPEQKESLVDQIMKEAKLSKEQAVAVVDQVMGQTGRNIRSARNIADDTESKAVTGLNDYLNSDEQKAIDPTGYVGDLTSEAAKATADPRSRQAQFDALTKLKSWTDPSLTAEEKFMMAQSRMAEERDQRGARDAALRDMASRGVRSGSAEMANLLGSQQVTSQNRLLGDLGAQANAQKRALGATQAFGEEANTISGQTFDEGFKRGSAADAISQFNNQLKTDYNLATDKFKADQQTQQWGKHTDVTGAQVKSANDKFGREDSVAGRELQGAGLKVGALTGGSNQVTDALKIALGQEEARRAEKLLSKKDEGLLPDSFPLLGKLF